MEIACGDAVIGNAQGKGEKRKICAQKWMKKKTDGMSSSAIIPHGCQFHADTFQQCVTIHTCIVVNSYKSKKRNKSQTNCSCICSLFESFWILGPILSSHLISMLPFGEEGFDVIRKVEKEIRGCYQFNPSPFLDPFCPPDTIPVFDPPPTGDGHI